LRANRRRTGEGEAQTTYEDSLNVDEREWLSEELRNRLEDKHPLLEFLVSTLRISEDAEDLDYIGRRLLAVAWTKSAGGHV
jgi:hypothetical protein